MICGCGFDLGWFCFVLFFVFFFLAVDWWPMVVVVGVADGRGGCGFVGSI